MEGLSPWYFGWAVVCYYYYCLFYMNFEFSFEGVEWYILLLAVFPSWLPWVMISLSLCPLTYDFEWLTTKVLVS